MAFTYFFRDMSALQAIKGHVIPRLRSYRYIWVWDAGCAMGPEPYSLAIIFREALGYYGFKRVKIFATDLDEENRRFGQIIAKAIYPEQSVKRIPRELLNKYFINKGSGLYRISDELKRCIVFQRHNLRSLEPVRTNFGLIVCKNVLLHFKERERIDIIKMFHQCLIPGGFFVTEQTQQLPMELSNLFMRVLPNVQLFQKLQ
ncbi:MAG: chemotaxis protein CheR [Deltaproteobacteria bacterium]|nr:chemotaxis protein CheR [Deltaproteobacteria bacterium]MBW1928374.1 chemotaxis protein CheR [Deltaproteobacteria bacterium]MBW2023827.1 chemotaxis protein CheR [Deltaproteobacteria bacterium]MBW2124560.1 chemotaxis protein CheR [Deltaproteobacteria bacterium]RLB20164.1 MAG: chemotaxis protein CheR [Deltaproteobacteria bacterium]